MFSQLYGILFNAKQLTPNSQILLQAGFSSLDWLDLEM
jgi:hypothetical protein